MNRRISFTVLLTIGLSAIVAARPTTAAEGRNPFENPVNLKVLPEDIGVEELRRTMVGFSGALNAKCSYCHEGNDSQSPRDLDFPKDGKRTKRIAREMIAMVANINERMTGFELVDGRQPVEVTCITCHRGQYRPELIGSVLAAALEEGGAESVIAKYADLRERYFGNHTYDLRPSTLAGFARRMASDGDPEGGIKVLDFANTEFPNEVSVIFALARVHQLVGNSARAIELLSRVVVLEPDSEFYAQQLEIAKGEADE